MSDSATTRDRIETGRLIGLLGGPLAAGAMLWSGSPANMDPHGWVVAALAIWMAIWWMTEAFPLPVTSLLPIIILPTFNILPLKSVISPFASQIIFLFLGGFIIAKAMEKWNLHLRLALAVLKLFGSDAKTVLAGLMFSTCFLGMWVSNTATVMMMMPISLSIAALLTQREDGTSPNPLENNFAKALMLGIAYSAVVGGLGTFVGTPTNAILLGHLQKTYNYDLKLGEWMMFGVPLLLVMFFLSWALLTILFLTRQSLSSNATAIIAEEFARLGKMKRGEKVVSLVFLLTAGLWIGSDFIAEATGLMMDDSVIALFGAMLLFIIPVHPSRAEFAITWRDAERLPWGVLVFFGGSLSLSAALSDTGVTDWLSAELVVLQGINLVWVVIALVALVILVSEMMSNIATVTAFLPILSSLAVALQVDPLLLLVPTTLAASCGFMMPGASAPNAIAFSAGFLRVKEMVKAGFLLDIIAIAIITLMSFSLVKWALHVQEGFPEWAHTKPAAEAPAP